MLQTKVVEKIKTQFYIEVDCSKIQVVCEIKCKKYGRAGQATDDVLCMLVN